MKLLDRIVSWYFSKEALPYWCIFILDCLLCFLSGIFVFWLFFRGVQTLGNIIPISRTMLLYVAIDAVMFKISHTYTGIIRYSSFVDLQRVARAMFAAFLVVWVIHYPIIFLKQYHFLVPLATRHIISIYMISTIVLWAVRVMVKMLYDVSFSSSKGMRTLIYGVRDGGVGLAKLIRNDKTSKFDLKGFIANEPGFEGRMLLGLKVYEEGSKLIEILQDKNIQAVLVSPIQNKAFREDTMLQEVLMSLGIHIYMSNYAKELTDPATLVNAKIEDSLALNQLQEVKIEDLLPRSEILVNLDAIGNLLKGKRIMITGSAGSIGSELVRQIATFTPGELMLIDQAETPQHDMRVYMNKHWPDIKTETVLTSITNQKRMEKLFSRFKPDYVFHAAAYKHVPMMEDNPCESVFNNIYGTKVIADLSVKYGVKKFVMLSTDKAVNPTNVMGCSKRICEIYVQSLDKKLKENGNGETTQFVTTRFGNVLGSNGSVIPLFEEQIKNGGPVTVTDPNVIRYFMLIPEACKLVLEAGTHGKGGEIFVFDMGQPVKIDDLAKRMIMLSGAKDIKIEYTGLRPGEKLFEEVLSNEENTIESFHEKIRIAKVREYDYHHVEQQIAELFEIAKSYDDMSIVKKMMDMVPEYNPSNPSYINLKK